MDGVITNTMPDHFKAWKAVLEPYGVQVTHYDVYSREGQRGINSIKEFFCEKKKVCTPQIIQELLHQKEQLFKKIVKRRFIPVARRFIKWLHQNHFKLALVTGTSRHELPRTLPDYIYKLFDVVVTGSDVTNGKPDPEPFLLALNKLKIKAQDAVVIENAPFGIRAAKAAGIKCLAIATSLREKFLKEADYIFSDMKTLRRKVNFILKDNKK